MESVKHITGEVLKNMFLFGAQNLKANEQEVNDLNVFPIPDGDTGENMYLTIKGGVDAISGKDGNVEHISNEFSKGMLLNARGNSGVILSQLFSGLAEGLKGFESVGMTDFALAMEKGVQKAYGAVARPVEGTILTVARESVENMRLYHGDDATAQVFFFDVLEEMKKSLIHTPDLLPTLKEAGVIDSGGAGLVYIIEGFLNYFNGQTISEIAVTADQTKQSVDFSKFNENSVMEFGYCTEFLLQLQNAKTDINTFSVEECIEFLNTVGDSVVAFITGTVLKVHVHTFTPWKVLQYAQSFGEFLTVKIENMTLQHNESLGEKKSTVSEINKTVKKARKKFAIVTVANGSGIIEIFKDLGADVVIDGGQTNNPSSQAFIDAFEEVNADCIFVLPNNSNIILTAKQAGEMYQGSDVRVIPSKSVGDGYAALSMLDFSSEDADLIERTMVDDMASVVTGMVSQAVRTTTVNGVDVKKDEYIGFTNKNVLLCSPDKICSAIELTEKLMTDDKMFIIVCYGKDASSENRQAYSQYVNEKFKEKEIYEINGEQAVYDFLLIVE